MSLVFLCLSVGILGFVTGRKIIPKDSKLKWLDSLLMVLIVVLLLILGAEIGSDENVVSSFGSIGFIAFILAVFAIAGSIIMVTLTRKTLGIDKWGKKIR